MKTKKIVKGLKEIRKDVKTQLDEGQISKVMDYLEEEKVLLDAAIHAVKENKKLKKRIKELENQTGVEMKM